MKWSGIGAAAAVGAALWGAPALACAGYGAAQQALAADDLTALETAYVAMVGAVDCDRLSPLVGRVLATLRQAEIMDRPLSAGEKAAALDAAFATGRPWRLLAARGYLAFGAADYERAKRLLTEAIIDASNLPEIERAMGLAPTPEQRRRLLDTHQEALLLSGNMDGAASRGGCFVRARSGFDLRPAAVPIRFATDSAAVRAEAEEDAEALYNCLAEIRLNGLVLVGHTDARGGAAYNRALSLRRAEAVRAWLRERGLPLSVAIDVEGAGEDEPFQPADPARYAGPENREARWALDRRVVLRLRQGE